MMNETCIINKVKYDCKVHVDGRQVLVRRFGQGALAVMKVSTGRRVLGSAVSGVALVAGGAVFAEDLGQPAAWEFRLQESASPVMDSIASFHSYLSVLITLITLFVLTLLAIVVVKFN